MASWPQGLVGWRDARVDFRDPAGKFPCRVKGRSFSVGSLEQGENFPRGTEISSRGRKHLFFGSRTKVS
jgi:hypothetical protein